MFDKDDFDDVLPLLTKCHLYSRNGVVPQVNVERYVSYEDEIPADTNICYYGNVTGWHRYESPASADLSGYRCSPSTSDLPVSR